MKGWQPILDAFAEYIAEHKKPTYSYKEKWGELVIDCRSGFTTENHADLESVLPDWKFEYLEDRELISFTFENWQKIPGIKLIQQIEDLIYKIVNSRGQAKLEAMADLIILLHENGIELRTDKDVV